ncbi:MAG: biotin--[acetyl-CoA-carboxylase] ligase [Deltaproteobacteria bacterium]
MTSVMMRKLNGLLRTENIGKVIHYYDEADSTNSVLAKLAENGASEGTAVIADTQTRGRGRLERKWISPPGVNLYISILLRPSMPPGESPLLTLLASIALVETLKKTGVEKPVIKWPNDVQIGGRKVAGVLTEMRSKGESVDFVILGIGVNINMTRAQINSEMREASRVATSVKENLGKDIERAKFTADMLAEIEIWYKSFARRGKPFILKEWTDRWGGQNRRVRVHTEDKNTYEGTAVGIDGDGHLLVKTDEENTVKVIAGDVTVI